MTGSFISPSLKTHLGPMHAQLKTSLRHLLALSNTDSVLVHPIHPFTLSCPQLPPITPDSSPSPTILHLILEPLAYNWEEAFS